MAPKSFVLYCHSSNLYCSSFKLCCPPTPDPVEAIKFEMERKGLTVKDLEPMIGKSNRVYEILNHKRSLTLKMIWKLHEGLGIPAESLIKPPQVRAS